MSIRRSAMLSSVIIGVILLGSFYPVADYPTYRVYAGELQFKGDLALTELEYFVTQFPERYAGSENNFAAAEYVSKRFEDLGLEVIHQDFITRSMFDPSVLNSENSPATMTNPGRTVKEVFREVSGRNVMGILPGISGETVVIGAHRDVINTVEGAEDNGSGTVVMLQLAEILTQSMPQHTYVFVSFDAEEIGLVGSEYFVRTIGSRNVVLAVSLDMLGWKDANAVGFYPFESTGKRTELWVYALVQQLAEREIASGVRPRSLLGDFWRNTIITIPTDSDPFLKRGIPSLGVLAIHTERQNYYTDTRPIHTLGDNMGIISAKTLELTGQFMEQFLKTMESSAVDRGYTVRYIPLATGHVPPWFTTMIYALLPILLGVILVNDVLLVWPGKAEARQRFALDARWILLSLASALATVVWWYLAFASWFINLPVVLVPLIGLSLPAASLAVLSLLRRRTKPETHASALVRSVTILGLLAIGLVSVGLPRTVIMLVIPTLLGMYVPWVWTIAFFPLFLILFMAHMPNFSNPQAALFFAWSLSAWMLTSVFALSKVRERKS